MTQAQRDKETVDALKRMYEQWTTIEEHYKAEGFAGEALKVAVTATMERGYNRISESEWQREIRRARML